ncbi:hypothetical protein ACRARG_12435 [Pseudooceanicola sp. C21-150M6]|uniref:hypothetical protein n=1 Tax=Pseudooceanicola sp. C21-150M6 TaxID=3434355 RepID=UPI003D7F361A
MAGASRLIVATYTSGLYRCEVFDGAVAGILVGRIFLRLDQVGTVTGATSEEVRRKFVTEVEALG